jgi:hypothetical protein
MGLEIKDKRNREENWFEVSDYQVFPKSKNLRRESHGNARFRKQLHTVPASGQKASAPAAAINSQRHSNELQFPSGT